jgi:hypothetical protein
MSDLVTISAERLKELEAAAAAIPILKEKLKKANHCDIDKINAYNKAHPEKAAERSKRCKEKNREAYNARRRELYRLKKEGGGTAPADASSTPVDAPN